jgi:hypothetical protein
VHNYHGAGIQTFMHTMQEKYACLGPYIPTWNAGAALWHPSVIAHRMRAAHHAYFWLLNMAEALQELRDLLSHRAADAVQRDIDQHLHKLQQRGVPLNPAHHASPFPDGAQCLTDYEPRAVREEASLRGKVVAGLATDDGTTPGEY